MKKTIINLSSIALVLLLFSSCKSLSTNVTIKENKQKESVYKMAVRNIDNWKRKSEHIEHFYYFKDFTIEHYFSFTE